jgi:small subunit ribosomal protein S3
MIERKFIDNSIKRLKAAEYIKKTFGKAGVSSVDIQRTTLATRIGLTVERPGFIIGRKGKTIKDLSTSVESILGIENPQIEVNDIQKPDLDPSVIARWIASMLERGLKPKRVMHKAVERVMGSGAIGAEIVLTGKIHGKGAKARKERIIAGYIKKAGDSTKLIREYHENAVLKQGIIGVLVRIVPPGVVFPDKVDISHLLKPAEKAPEPAKPVEVAETKVEQAELKKETKEAKKEEKETKKGESGDTEKKRAAGTAKRRTKRKAPADKE